MKTMRFRIGKGSHGKSRLSDRVLFISSRLSIRVSSTGFTRVRSFTYDEKKKGRRPPSALFVRFPEARFAIVVHLSISEDRGTSMVPAKVS